MKSEKTLAELGRERTDEFVGRLRLAMSEIGKETLENDGVYPRNSGRLNVAELCRRARATAISLHGPKHAGTTKIEVDAWLASLRADVPTSAQGARQKPHAQKLGWKEKYDLVAAQLKATYSIEIVQRDALIAALKKEVAVLKFQIKKQREAGSKVVGIDSARKPKAN